MYYVGARVLTGTSTGVVLCRDEHVRRAARALSP